MTSYVHSAKRKKQYLLHILTKCIATVSITYDNFGHHLMDYNELRKVRCFFLMMFVKVSRRF